jgi:hypothetical protein
MKHNIYYTGAALAVVGALIAGVGLANDPPSTPKMDPQMEEMMKKAEAACTPSAAHKLLEPLVGNWTAETKCWMVPGSPPTVSHATAKSSWIMNGRFVQQEFTGDFMGKPFHGLGFTGFDNVRQKYGSVWIDDMSTTVFTSEGEADSDARTITFTGVNSCPMTGEKHKTSKLVYRILSRDQHVFEMHDPTKGANSKTMEITYTREGASITKAE